MSEKKNEPVTEQKCIIKGTELLRHCALIKTYIFSGDRERAYLCADHIEQELHHLLYGDGEIEWNWK